jgi:hypothetical protein
MKHKELRYRQIHLDFHTSPAIEGIGEAFDKKQFQDALKRGHVNSITCFSSGHHGWSYHPTKVAKQHPHLKFDLLRAQVDACKEINVKTPVYLTAGVDNQAAEEHPEWREMDRDGTFLGWTADQLKAGFKTLCFNTPYLDYLCRRIEEAVTLFPEADGIFLDIIHQSPCYCKHCLAGMKAAGLDPEKPGSAEKFAQITLMKYYKRTTESAKINNKDMPVFHNSGHISMGKSDILPYFSHLELESLPTGGWGYDHFPLSAKYVQNLGYDFMGMTGKFHTTWGEFGGYKHPNALRYECAAMIAYGAKCSIGDQLHPSGLADTTTYDIIGAAYKEVEEKEPWCVGAVGQYDIALISQTANRALSGADLTREDRTAGPDTGAARILLEGHYLFTIIDETMPFEKYKMLILPDDVRIGSEFKAKLDSYLAAGGRLFLTGQSGLDENGKALFDLGAELEGPSPFSPDFFLSTPDLSPEYIHSPQVMYMKSNRLKVTTGESLGVVYDPYFNRTYEHFCSHQHTPNRPEPSGYDGGVIKNNILYLAHPVFSQYFSYGAVPYKDFIVNCLDRLLGDEKSLTVGLPSTGRISLTKQSKEDRSILHLLYANTVTRGAAMSHAGGNNQSGSDRPSKPVEVIEELLPLYNIPLSLRMNEAVKRVTLEPSGREISFKQNGEKIELSIAEFSCHEMVVFHHK